MRFIFQIEEIINKFGISNPVIFLEVLLRYVESNLKKQKTFFSETNSTVEYIILKDFLII